MFDMAFMFALVFNDFSLLKVEICRFGCPDHCQNPGNYVAREQEVTSSISSYKEPKLSVSSSNKQETYVPSASLEESDYTPPIQSQPKPEIQPTFNGYQPDPRNNNNNIRPNSSRKPVEHRRTNKPLKRRISPPTELQRSGGQYAPPTLNLPIASALKSEARSASSPLGLSRLRSGYDLGPNPNRQQPPPQRPTDGGPARPHWRGTRREDQGAYESEEGDNQENEETQEEQGGFANFLGFKLPSLPKISLPFFGGGDDDEGEDQDKKDSQRKTGVKSEAIPVPLGRIPPKDALQPQVSEQGNQHQRGFKGFYLDFHLFKAKRPSSVPVSRTANHGQPLVYPSSFNTANRPVEPIEELDGPFPYGPRALNAKSLEKVQKRKRRSSLAHHLSTRSADVGVRSGYEVVSQVDLDFTPDEERPDVSVLKVRDQSLVQTELAPCDNPLSSPGTHSVWRGDLWGVPASFGIFCSVCAFVSLDRDFDHRVRLCLLSATGPKSDGRKPTPTIGRATTEPCVEPIAFALSSTLSRSGGSDGGSATNGMGLPNLVQEDPYEWHSSPNVLDIKKDSKKSVLGTLLPSLLVI